MKVFRRQNMDGNVWLVSKGFAKPMRKTSKYTFTNIPIIGSLV